jgi:signal transduction histidine kinase
MTRILRLSIFLLLGLFAAEAARAETANLQPGRGIADLKHHLSYYSDPAASLGEILRQYRGGAFGSDLEASLLATNYAPEAWAAVEIFNATLDDGRRPDPFVLTVDVPLASALDAYVIRESGFTENLLNYSVVEPFVPEDHSVARLRTPVFEIAPQERVTLLVKFQFGPVRSFDMALETPAELEASAFVSGVSHTAFYAFTISCLVFFFGFHLAMKNWIGLLYAAQFGVGLCLIAYIDGLWFRFFFPDSPQYQSPVGFFLLFTLSGIGFLISGRSLASKGAETKLSRGLAWASLLSLAGFLFALYSPGTYAALVGYVLLVLMFVAVFLASLDWRKQEGEIHLAGMLIPLLGSIMVVAVIALMVMGSRADVIPVSTAVKGVFSVLLIATMTSLTAHIINLRRKHADAVEAEMDALEAEAKRSQELLVAERNYTRARELASLRQRQLATASHDLKQPIASLRMNFDSLAVNLNPDVRQRLGEAFDYMEALSNDYLRDTTPPAEGGEGIPDGREDGPDVDEPGAAEQEAYDVSLVLDTVHQMFDEEAISKGLRLRRVRSSKKTTVPPLVLMRIVSNLVSNAVKYTERGGVLIGIRGTGNAMRLCVLDTGPGMDEDEVRIFAEAYNKGEKSEGHGLGLSVCYELSSENGMTLTCNSRKGRGTVFCLEMPVARD